MSGSSAELAPQFSAAEYSRAILNIPGDFTEERAHLRDTQQAVLNILTDFTEKNDRVALTQRAVLNILEDFDSEAKQRKHAEAEVRQINAELERHVRELELANRDLEGFSYSVAHDLRTPLRAIDGFSRILLEDYADKLDAEGQRVLNVVRDGTLKLSQLIDDILAFSRVGRLEMKNEPVDTAALVRGALAGELAAALAERKPAVEIGLLPEAHGDAAMLQRVWINLIANAIKFTAPKADARIEIGAAVGERETVYFVRDNGVGFEMQYADKLFGVFQRLHGAEYPGTGIGLAIVRRVVARHGGRAWAESRLGEGATFYFALPEREESKHG